MTSEDASPEAMRAEIRRLNEELDELRQRKEHGFSRKVLLTGGAGALVGAAGASMLTPPARAIAAPPELVQRSAPGSVVPGGALPTWFYLQIVGSTQGRFTGDLDGDGLPDLIVGRKMDSRLSQAIDSASGLPAGKRIWRPLVFVKEWGASSPQLASALVNNETLSTVNVYLPKLGANNTGVLLFTIQLQNARLVRFRQYIGDPTDEPEPTTRVLEEIAFTFQKITWTSIPGKTQASDDWQI